MAHILHISQLYHPARSGAGRYFQEIGERLAAEGQRVTVLATDAIDLEHLWLPGRRSVAEREERLGGVRVVRLPVRRLPGPPLLYPAMRRLMVELGRLPGSAPLLSRIATLTPRLDGLAEFFAREGPFDAIHAGNITLDFALVPALAHARRTGAPFLCTPFIHLGVPGDSSLARYYTMPHQIRLLQQSRLVATMTELEADALAARGVPRQQIRVVGVGVAPPEVLGGDAARFRGEQRIAGPLVLYIGALARDKGALDTIEAMRRVWAAGGQATLAMIGAPLAHFERYFAELPEAERARIRLLPYAPDSVKHDALAAADIFCMPSRTDSFGIVYLEAWCYRAPVVGARAGGVPGVIRDGETGVLVPYGDPGALAAALGRLLGDPAERRRLGEAGHAAVMGAYTWDRVYARARAMLGEALAPGAV